VARALALALAVALAAAHLACSGAPRRGRPAPSSAPDDDSGLDYRAKPLVPTRLSDPMRTRCRRYAPYVEEVARAHRLDPTLVLAVIRIESGFRPDAGSRAGARGLMQVMPRTGRGMKCRDLWDPEDNILCGVRVLRRYLDRFEGDVIYGLAAYNGGPGYVQKEYEARRLPRNFGYVELVLKAQAFFRRRGCDG
jgi:soluble lytic murein transglycosylase-like protein